MARLVRRLRALRNVRGWQRLAQRLAGDRGDFEIDNGGARFAGTLSSFIDRQAYLFGGYERDLIAHFLAAVGPGGTVLDVGANVGNHSVAFSRNFDRVIAFEPNPALWPALERNAALNADRTIDVRRVGLSDEAGEFQLYDVDADNRGLGTFLREEQYDKPLRPAAVARTERADDYLGDITGVRAVKIDVQGFEPQVLRGMQRILAANRPAVWAEFSAGTLGATESRAAAEALFPYPVTIRQFTAVRGPIRSRADLVPYTAAAMVEGDYLITPR